MSDAGCVTFYKQPVHRIKDMGLYSEWDRFDIFERLKPLFSRGWRIDPMTHKVDVSVKSVPLQTPWWHNPGASLKLCGLWHNVMFNHFGFIPKGCQECWKIVVRPRTLKELFALQAFEKAYDGPAKCGIEIRSYTAGHYGGYFYNNSLDQGRARYKIVREAVSDLISPDVKVILKRACTEMELHAGPSIFWQVTKDNAELEEYIAARVEYAIYVNNNQPDFYMNQLYKRWVQWAHSHADMTYLEYTNGHPLYEPPITYHEGDLDTIKRDFMTARLSRTGLDESKILDARDKLLEVAGNYGLTPIQAGAVFGYTDVNPLFAGEENQATYIKEEAA